MLPGEPAQEVAADGEVLSMRTERSRTFRTVQEYGTRSWLTPVHYRDSNDRWQELDLSLAPDGRGGYRTRGGAVAVSLPASLSAPVLNGIGATPG